MIVGEARRTGEGHGDLVLRRGWRGGCIRREGEIESVDAGRVVGKGRAAVVTAVRQEIAVPPGTRARVMRS